MLRDCSSSSSRRKQHSHHQSIAAAAPATMAAASPTFSLFFPLPNTNAYQCAPADVLDDDSHSSITTSPSSPSSSTGSVDCTLSLGTPSSRRAAAESAKQRPPCLALPSRVAVSWDVAAAPADQSCCRCPGGSRPSPAAASKSAAHEQGQDPALVHRRCANCGTTSTPLWRNGPRGPKSLCNACGIRFKKKERRAAATATSAMDQGGCGYLAQYGAAAAAAEMAYYGGCEGPALPCGDVADAVAVPAQAAAFAAVWPERMTLFQYN